MSNGFKFDKTDYYHYYLQLLNTTKHNNPLLLLLLSTDSIAIYIVEIRQPQKVSSTPTASS